MQVIFWVTREGILVADGIAASSALGQRIAASVASGEAAVIVVNSTAATAPVVVGELGHAVHATRELSHVYEDARNLDANALTRDLFAGTLGTIAGILAIPTGPAGIAAASLVVSENFKLAYNLFSAASRDANLGGLAFDYLESLKERGKNIRLPSGQPIDEASLADLEGWGLNTAPDSVIEDIGNQFDRASVTRSPLIVDLDGDGVETRSISDGAHFDHDGNGLAESSGWVSSDDGLLVWDRNSNGTIDNGGELFGSGSQLSNGLNAANGFVALAELDSNHDGKVDASDTVFSQLRVWKDGDGDAVASNGELLTLSEANVQSLGVSYVQQTITDAQGNQHLQAGQYVGTDGLVHAMDDVWFAVDTARTVDLNPVEVSDIIAALPDVAGFGNVRSLRQAMARDASGRLQSLVESYVEETDPSARNAIVTQLIYVWAGVDGVDPNSRATTQNYGNAIGDARKLASLEAFLGEAYLGTWCWGQRDPNPHGPASKILLNAFDTLSAYVSSQLKAQTEFKDLYDSIGVVWNTDALTIDLDTTAVISALQERYSAQEKWGRSHF